MEDALAEHPDVARGLVELFVLRLDPARPADADEQARALEERLAGIVDGVASLDEDRILRGFLQDGSGRAADELLPGGRGRAGEAVPLAQARSRSGSRICRSRGRCSRSTSTRPRVEAVHLRGGKVARGGIRWSDRKEDFRTEVLGLMKAQSVKNAVIVPVGAKGGFVVKRPPAGDDRAALLAEVVECYRIFMRGLLDITDTIAAGELVPPRDVVRHDEDDPYLVVAADKGTATFSDIANAISAEYGFWLGDAFASGGSAGYDHKAMGITARGAWESVRAALPRARGGRRDDRFHRGRDRRHVRRRVRERDAALPPHQARRRLRPPARLPRPGPRPGAELPRARAPLPAAGLVLGRLRRGADLARRRRLPPHRQVDPALTRGAGGARRRGRAADAERADPGAPAARRSTCSGTAASART